MIKSTSGLSGSNASNFKIIGFNNDITSVELCSDMYKSKDCNKLCNLKTLKYSPSFRIPPWIKSLLTLSS